MISSSYGSLKLSVKNGKQAWLYLFDEKSVRIREIWILMSILNIRVGTEYIN